jgi:hypothetical protein
VAARDVPERGDGEREAEAEARGDAQRGNRVRADVDHDRDAAEAEEEEEKRPDGLRRETSPEWLVHRLHLPIPFRRRFGATTEVPARERAGDRARTGDIQLGREKTRGEWSRLEPPRRLAVQETGLQ